LSEGNRFKELRKFKRKQNCSRGINEWPPWKLSVRITDAYADLKSFLSLLTMWAPMLTCFIVDRNIHGTGASINNMKKQKHTQHTLLIYFWMNNVLSVRAPDGLNASWRNGCPGDNISLHVVANEAFHYWRVEVETMICEVLICA
jgi:hypothetical protein